MNKSDNIPTDEEFARASRLMKEKSRGLDRVRISVMEHFSGRLPLHRIDILVQRDVDFRAYVFFKGEKDLASCMRSGVDQEIIEFVRSEIERVGRGDRSETTVAFEFDSHENVAANFEGNYFLRLR